MQCQFDNTTLVCRECGYKAKSLPTFRVCKPPPVVIDRWKPFLVGTFIERQLKRVGITPHRVETVTGKPCGCGERKLLLDKLGVLVQVAARSALMKVRKFAIGD